MGAPRSGREGAECEAAAKREGIEGYRITERATTGGLAPASARVLYYPVLYLEPYEENEPALGFDFASDPIARATLDQSRDTGRPAASQRLELVQDAQGQISFLISVPVFFKNTPVNTVEDRRKNLQGFVVGCFRISDVVLAALSQGMPLGIDVTLYDESAPAADRLLFFYPSLTREGHTDPIADRETARRLGMVSLSQLEVGGRTWSVVSTPAPKFYAMQYAWLEWAVLAGGLAMTSLLAASVLVNISRTAARLAAETANRAKDAALADMRREIHERTRAESEMRKLWIAVEQSPIMIVITDREGRIEYANPKFTQVTGYTLDDVRGQTPRILKSGKTSLEEYQRLWQTLLSGGEWRGEFYNKKKNGEYYWEQAFIAPVMDGSGVLTHFVAVKEDVTERRRLEKSLKEAERQLRETTSRLPGMVFQFYARQDGSMGLNYVSEQAKRLLGLAPEPEGFLERFTAAFLPECRDDFLRSVGKAVSEVSEWKYEGAMRKPSGEIVWISGLATPMKRDDEIMYDGVIIDVTDRKQAEEKVRLAAEWAQRENAKLAAMISGMEEGVVFADADNVVVEVNDFMCRFAGRQRSDDPRQADRGHSPGQDAGEHSAPRRWFPQERGLQSVRPPAADRRRGRHPPRAAHLPRRQVRRRAAERDRRHGTGRGASPGRSGHPRQERVPGHHEPRNPHAA